MTTPRLFRRNSSTIILWAGPIAIDGERLMVFGGPQASFCTPGELVGRDLALPGQIPVACWSFERLKEMPKQRLAEVKLSGNLSDGNSGLVDVEDGACAIEI